MNSYLWTDGWEWINEGSMCCRNQKRPGTLCYLLGPLELPIARSACYQSFTSIELRKGYEKISATSWQNQQNGMCVQRRLRSAWASALSDQSLLCAQWVVKDQSFLHESDQTGRMPRLIWVFALCACHFVGFVMRRLISLVKPLANPNWRSNNLNKGILWQYREPAMTV